MSSASIVSGYNGSLLMHHENFGLRLFGGGGCLGVSYVSAVELEGELPIVVQGLAISSATQRLVNNILSISGSL